MNFIVARFAGIFALLAILSSLLIITIESTQTVSHSELILISEVGWGGTAASSSDEFIELFNPNGQPVDLSGWTLNALDGTPAIGLSGVIPAYGFYLLERTDDSSVTGIAADQIYSGSLSNSGETLELRDGDGVLSDSANGDGGSWPAGTGSPDFRSMERVAPELAAEWQSNDGSKSNGLDADGNPLNATAKSENVGWGQVRPDSAELSLSITQSLSPALIITNTGNITAENLTISATVSTGLQLITSSLGTPTQPEPDTYVWQVATLPAAETLHESMALAVQSDGYYSMTVRVSTTTTETNPFNNSAVTSHKSWTNLLDRINVVS